MPRRKKGGSLVNKAVSQLKKANNMLRQSQVLSTALDLAGKHGLADKVASYGYGRKRRVRRRGRGQRGGSLFGDIASKITSLPAGVILGGTMGLQGAIKGLGRQSGGMMPLTNENRKILIM